MEFDAREMITSVTVCCCSRTTHSLQSRIWDCGFSQSSIAKQTTDLEFCNLYNLKSLFFLKYKLIKFTFYFCANGLKNVTAFDGFKLRMHIEPFCTLEGRVNIVWG